jgi:excisionase family DNA binding protein
MVVREILPLLRENKNYDEILDYKRASEYLKIPKHTLEKWVSERRIPFYKVGKRVIFKRSVLDRWLNQHLKEPLNYRR